MGCNMLAKAVLASLCTGVLLGSAQLMADCKFVTGKITNNSAGPGEVLLGYDVSTAGIVEFAAKNPDPFSKLKCGIVGVVNPYVLPDEPDPDLEFLGPLPSFTHLISCEEHSQLKFDTHGKFTAFDFLTYTASFVEHAVPISDSGTGAFDGATGDGELIINGTFNLYTKEIDMKFGDESQICK